MIVIQILKKILDFREIYFILEKNFPRTPHLYFYTFTPVISISTKIDELFIS